MHQAQDCQRHSGNNPGFLLTQYWRWHRLMQGAASVEAVVCHRAVTSVVAAILSGFPIAARCPPAGFSPAGLRRTDPDFDQFAESLPLCPALKRVRWPIAGHRQSHTLHEQMPENTNHATNNTHPHRDRLFRWAFVHQCCAGRTAARGTDGRRIRSTAQCWPSRTAEIADKVACRRRALSAVFRPLRTLGCLFQRR